MFNLRNERETKNNRDGIRQDVDSMAMTDLLIEQADTKEKAIRVIQEFVRQDLEEKNDKDYVETGTGGPLKNVMDLMKKFNINKKEVNNITNSNYFSE